MKKYLNLILSFVCFFVFSATTTTYAETQLYSTYDYENNEEEIFAIDDWTSVNETPGSPIDPNTPAPALIIDTCNLTRIRDTTVTNITRATCFLSCKFKYGDNKTKTLCGSGIMVGPSTLLTAAHCVYQPDYGGYADLVSVAPARNGSSCPYGKSRATKLSIPDSFKSKDIAQNDIAVINIASPLGNQSGYLACKVVSPDVLTGYYTTVEMNGYPESGHQTLEGVTTLGEMWGMGGAITYVNGKLLRHLHDTIPGHSGSGLVYASQYVIGVHNKYPYNSTEYNYGCRLDNEYLKWINGLMQ